MARPGHPASERFQSGGRRVTSSNDAGMEGKEEEEDQSPIFSLSKSSMDVLMAAAPPHKRDPAWTRVDLRRSSSTNTHSDQNSLALQQLHAHLLRRVNAPNSHQPTQAAQHAHTHGSLPLGERWIANVDRWRACSGSTHSSNSNPETVVCRGRTVRPWSLTQVALSSGAPDSPTSKLDSPLTPPSPFISPLQTPPLPRSDPLSPSPLTSPQSTHQHEDTRMPSSTPSPLPSPLRAHTTSPLSPSALMSYSPEFLRLTSTEEECFPVKHTLSFQFPYPSLEGEGGFEIVSPEPGYFVDGAVERLPSLTFSPGGTQSLGVGVGSPVEVQMFISPNPPVERPESRAGASACHLELPWQPGQSCPTGSSPCRGWRSPMVSSLSDSRLNDRCRCNANHSGPIASTRATKGEEFREEGTMTSQVDLVDAAVQTASPAVSWWNLRRNMSSVSYSTIGSHSILGSPPGSRLNLRSSLGSTSNLVSPSSSMFPLDSGEEDCPNYTVSSPSLYPMVRRRSCLKAQGEERGGGGGRDELGRRSSMKQVQWDEDGMTWDVHGASLDPEELSTAIRRHLDLQSGKKRESPRPSKHKSKKKTATKVAETPLVENIVKVMAPESSLPVMVDTATSMVESESEERPEAEWEREREREREESQREREREKEASKNEERAEVVCVNSKAGGDTEKEDGEGEEEEVYGEEGAIHRKSPSRGSGHSQKKKSVIRSLRRPGWCGVSKKHNN